MNIKELKNKRKELLLNLNPSELTSLFNNLNNKLINCKSVEDIEKVNFEIFEIENILSKKYSKIHEINLNSMINILVEKYVQLRELFFQSYLIQMYYLIQDLINNIFLLQKMFCRYYFTKSNIYDFLIKVFSENIKSDIAELDSLKDFVEVAVNNHEIIFQLNILVEDLLSEYENLLKNPFEVAVNIKESVENC